MLANINSLASNCDVLLLQETRGSNLSQIRHLLAVNNFSHPFLNPNPDSAHSGGTAMLVSQRVAASFKLVHEVLIPGVAQLLRFVPLSSNHLCSHPFLVLNAYLQSGDPATAISQMQAISDLVPDPPRYSFVWGGRLEPDGAPAGLQRRPRPLRLYAAGQGGLLQAFQTLRLDRNLPA